MGRRFESCRAHQLSCPRRPQRSFRFDRLFTPERRQFLSFPASQAVGERQSNLVPPARVQGVFKLAFDNPIAAPTLLSPEEKRMQSVVGIFRSLSDASQAVTRLRQNGIPENKINLLASGPFDQQRAELSEVPISETEQPGMGKGVGSLLGGSVGVAGG